MIRPWLTFVLSDPNNDLAGHMSFQERKTIAANDFIRTLTCTCKLSLLCFTCLYLNVLIKYSPSLCYSLCLIIKKTKTTEWCGGGKADILNYSNYMLFTLLKGFVRTWAVFVWPWRMVSLRSRYYLFHQLTKISKVGLVILPVTKS